MRGGDGREQKQTWPTIQGAEERIYRRSKKEMMAMKAEASQVFLYQEQSGFARWMVELYRRNVQVGNLTCSARLRPAGQIDVTSHCTGPKEPQHKPRSPDSSPSR